MCLNRDTSGQTGYARFFYFWRDSNGNLISSGRFFSTDFSCILRLMYELRWISSGVRVLMRFSLKIKDKRSVTVDFAEKVIHLIELLRTDSSRLFVHLF